MRGMARAQLLLFVAAAAMLVASRPTLAQTAYPPSPSECAAEADRAARGNGTVLGGAAKGAARGALFGAIIGGEKQTKRGAAVGAITGTVGGARNKNDIYNQVYDACMRGRSYGY